MAMALPLLPSENINEGFNAIVLFTDASGIGAEMMTFLKYLRSTWILGVGPETLSVFGQPSRTNNFQEAYHMELKRLMGIHPGVWQFTDSLRHQEERKVKTFAALANGRRTHQGRKKQYIERDRHICDAQRSLRNGAYSVEEFLRSVALRRIAEEEERIAAMRENDSSSEEENSEDEDEPEIVGDEGLANVGRVAVNNNEEDIADVVEGLAFDEAVIDMQVNADENGDIEPQFAVDDDDVVDPPHNGHEPRNRCTVCWKDHVASFICVPCGHICLCPTCAATISGKPTAAERVCPFCKTETNTIIRAYQDL